MHVIYNKTISDRLRISFWILEVFELIFCSIILGITGSASVGMKSDLGFEKIPGKLSYNIGAAAFSLIAFLIMIPLDLIRPRWWGYCNTVWQPWPRVAVNVVFTGLWIGTVPASFYTCGDLCSAAGGEFNSIHFATFYCECYTSESGYRSLALRGVEQRTGRYEATEGLDIFLTVIFLFSTALLVAFHWVKEPQEEPPQEPSPYAEHDFEVE